MLAFCVSFFFSSLSVVHKQSHLRQYAHGRLPREDQRSVFHPNQNVRRSLHDSRQMALKGAPAYTTEPLLSNINLQTKKNARILQHRYYYPFVSTPQRPTPTLTWEHTSAFPNHILLRGDLFLRVRSAEFFLQVPSAYTGRTSISNSFFTAEL